MAFTSLAHVCGAVIAASAQSGARPDKVASSVMPSVDCATVITLNSAADKNLPRFWAALTELGFDRDRVTVQREERDTSGVLGRGVWIAHTSAWAAARTKGCQTLLVLEDDVFFDLETVQRGALNRAEVAVSSMRSGNAAYDLMLLGYGLGANFTASPSPHNCAYHVQHWVNLHAYVISAAGMDRLATLREMQDTENVSRGHIDIYLGSHVPANRTLALYPPVAYQTYHTSTNVWYGNETEQLEEQQRLLKINSEPNMVKLQLSAGPFNNLKGAEKCIGDGETKRIRSNATLLRELARLTRGRRQVDTSNYDLIYQIQSFYIVGPTIQQFTAGTTSGDICQLSETDLIAAAAAFKEELLAANSQLTEDSIIQVYAVEDGCSESRSRRTGSTISYYVQYADVVSSTLIEEAGSSLDTQSVEFDDEDGNAVTSTNFAPDIPVDPQLNVCFGDSEPRVSQQGQDGSNYDIRAFNGRFGNCQSFAATNVITGRRGRNHRFLGGRRDKCKQRQGSYGPDSPYHYFNRRTGYEVCPECGRCVTNSPVVPE